MIPSHIASMKTDIVNVRVKVNLPRIQLVTTEVGPIVAGSEVDMERWKADVLAKWGMVDSPDDSTSLLARAYANRDREQAGRIIEPIEDIYHTIPEIIAALNSEGLLTQKMGSVRTLLEDVSSSRTNKITRAARMGQEPVDSLSPEERWFHANLRRIFDVWRRETERLVEDGKPD
ncbi:MAG: hypothetical protein HXS50_00465 [Theionarchaea archaeon]|nr:hypothetical protein [Theionarchaea archaeon]